MALVLCWVENRLHESNFDGDKTYLVWLDARNLSFWEACEEFRCLNIVQRKLVASKRSVKFRKRMMKGEKLLPLNANFLLIATNANGCLFRPNSMLANEFYACTNNHSIETVEYCCGDRYLHLDIRLLNFGDGFPLISNRSSLTSTYGIVLVR